jgi:hypothetical protein
MIVFASDITAQQALLRAAGDALHSDVTSCATLDTATRAGWDAFYKTLVSFTSKPALDFPWPWERNFVLATANTGDTVMQYWKQLAGWQQALRPICRFTGPDIVKPDPTPLIPSTLTTGLRYAGIGAAFVAAAYVAVKVLEFLPKPASKALPAKRAA